MPQKLPKVLRLKISQNKENSRKIVKLSVDILSISRGKIGNGDKDLKINQPLDFP